MNLKVGDVMLSKKPFKIASDKDKAGKVILEFLKIPDKEVRIPITLQGSTPMMREIFFRSIKYKIRQYDLPLKLEKRGKDVYLVKE
jgi:hypothetical protein